MLKIKEIDINKFNKSITFQNRGIGFTQIGIAGEILDLIDDLQQENKQLKERIEYLERSNDRREDTIIEQRQEISDLEDNWGRLKEWVKEQPIFNYLAPVDIKNKMQELERSDSNEI